MDYFVLFSGVVASISTIIHFTVGVNIYLRSVMRSKINEMPKRVVQALFHSVSVYLITTSVILISFSLGYNLIFENTIDVLIIIGFIYGGFAVVQFVVAMSANLVGGIFKMYQWFLWALVALLLLISVN